MVVGACRSLVIRGSHQYKTPGLLPTGSEERGVLGVGSSVQIKLLFCALTGCTSHKTVHPENCSRHHYIAIINGSKNVHTPGAHLLKSCTRPWKCAHRVQGAPLISDTGEYSCCNTPLWSRYVYYCIILAYR